MHQWGRKEENNSKVENISNKNESLLVFKGEHFFLQSLHALHLLMNTLVEQEKKLELIVLTSWQLTHILSCLHLSTSKQAF